LIEAEERPGKTRISENQEKKGIEGIEKPLMFDRRRGKVLQRQMLVNVRSEGVGGMRSR
jgi:hypothetical protein